MGDVATPPLAVTDTPPLVKVVKTLGNEAEAGFPLKV